MKKFFVDPNIRIAETLPASFYHDPSVWNDLREKVFLKSWQWIGDNSLLPTPQSVHPFTLLEDYLEEPLMLVHTEEKEIICLSNVCTHRGNLIIHEPGKVKSLICNYHGRRFSLEGKFEHMPEFGNTQNFPGPCENLPDIPLEHWGDFLFVGIQPQFDLSGVLKVMNERIGFMPLAQFKHFPGFDRDYMVNCHWALYCDNYLEGFHIPFVHDDLNQVLDYGSYTTEVYEFCNLQIGFASKEEEIFELPPGHVDEGKAVSAYYFWVFPNMMFNFYPWGLSINIVKPISPEQTCVSFISYVYDESKRGKGAGAALDKVEKEDEFVVEGVQKGLRSSLYKTGRFSPDREQGVHHFHRLLSEALN